MNIEYSAEQKAIFDFLANNAANGIVKARAGTGKTFTIEHGINHVPCDVNRILYAVFNKKNQNEAVAKIKDPRVTVRTLHSLGFAYIKTRWKNANPNQDVEFDRVNTIMSRVAHLEKRDIAGMVVRLISFAKNTLIKPTLEDLGSICEREDIDFSDYDTDGRWIALEAMQLAMEPNPSGHISFDDMVWLPIVNNWVSPWFDLVIIDEAQDMNLPQLTMARQASTQRVIVVGDDRQAIYGFRGAVQNGLSMMKAVLSATELKLTTTYRCPRLVVELAAEIVPDYKSAPNAAEGEVHNITDHKMLTTAQAGDVVISRLNAPLMSCAMRFLRLNIPCRIEGRDIGKQLENLIKSFKADSIKNLSEKIEAWVIKEVDRLSSKKNAERKIESIHDQAATLHALCEGSNTIGDVIARVNKLFADTVEGSAPIIVLSTVHKAKGLEWDNVFLLRETFGTKGSEEQNIYYVALTRAKKRLYFVLREGSKAELKCKLKVNTPEAQPSAQIAPPPRKVPLEQMLGRKNRSPEPKQPISKPREHDHDLDIPRGCVKRRVGDVIAFNGFEYVIDFINDCRARAICLTRQTVTIKNELTETETTFQQAPAQMNISVTCEPKDVLRRLSADEMPVNGRKNKTMGNKENPNMANKNKNESGWRPTGGRSEYIHGLREKGMKANEAFELVNQKFPGGGRKWFDQTWKSKPRGQGAPKKSAKKADVKSPPPRKGKAAAKTTKAAPKRKTEKKAAPVAAAAPATAPTVAAPPPRKQDAAPETTQPAATNEPPQSAT